MISRSERILLSLLRADGPLTSMQLADVIGVSSRTVKADMPRVAHILEDHGARLEAKRNRGYSIVVRDENLYGELVRQIELRAIRIDMANYDHALRVLHIERRLVSSPDGVLIDQICSELALSRSATQRALQDAIRFLHGFRLEVVSSPGRGMRVVGDEHLVRLALVELFEIHFDMFTPSDLIPEYARWIACEDNKRQLIRHEFLRVLRNSAISMRDGLTQRLAVYLVVMKNRIEAGLNISLPTYWVSEIKESACYEVAVDVLSALSVHFPEFGVSNEEAAFFAILLLRYLDVSLARDARAISPYLYPLAHLAANRVLAKLDDELGGELLRIEGVQPLMEQCLLPLVAAQRYRLDGCELYDNDAESGIAGDPVCIFLAVLTGSLIEDMLQIALSRSDYLFLAMAMLWVLDGVEPPAKPLRLLVTNAMGTEFANRQLQRLLANYPGLIDRSSKACELYEIRGFDPASYDAVITDVATTGYRYGAPRGFYGPHLDATDEASIHDDVLIGAYALEAFAWSSDRIQIKRGIAFDDIEELIQAISLCSAEDEGQFEVRQELLLRQAYTAGPVGMTRYGFLFESVSKESERIEWYECGHPMRWGDSHVDAVVYVCVCLSNGLVHLQALSRALRFMPQQIGDWASCPESISRSFYEALQASYKFSK